MDTTLKVELDRARAAAAEARALAQRAHRAGGSRAEAERRQRELDRLEDLGRSAVLECLEGGHLDLALEAARGMAGALEDEGQRAARTLALARRAQEAAP
jgi:hypothetical protein